MYTGTSIIKNKPIAVAPAPTISYLIDDVGQDASVALSFRKLREAYTGDCIIVEKEDGGTTQAIGFDANGILDTAAIATFCGSSRGLIQTWYDQSGKGKNFTATGTSTRPIIYDGSAVTTFDSYNGNGNTRIACYSGATVTSTSGTGTRFLQATGMEATRYPTVTMVSQINTYNGIGIIHNEYGNGYGFGTYNNNGGNFGQWYINNSAGSNLTTIGAVGEIPHDGTDAGALTTYFNDDAGAGTSWWDMRSYQGNIATKTGTYSCFGFNTANYEDVRIMAFTPATALYSNNATAEFIYWDFNGAQESLDSTQRTELTDNLEEFYSMS